MAIPALPSDIIIDILTRLPSKTLIRFKSVSKQWYSLINSPNFINLHLSQTLISQNFRNIIISRFSLFSSSISDNHTNPNFHFSELDHPLEQIPHSLPQIIGSINGVVCISLYHKSSTSIFLYNPSTKTHRLIPPFSYTAPHFGITDGNVTAKLVDFGFGYDSVSRDYKVVRMTETFKNNVSECREASVYSLRNDSWKCVSDHTMRGQGISGGDRVVFVNESLHFIVVDTKSQSQCKVKCFNIRTETFSIFDFPMFDDKFIKMKCVMRELGECFTVLVNYQNMIVSPMGDPALARVDLWVMKEYGNEESWIRLFSSSDPAMLQAFSYVRPLVYSKDKDRVLLEWDGLSFGWYCWGNNTFEKITVHGWPAAYANGPYDTWTFLDSLVSLGKDKDES